MLEQELGEPIGMSRDSNSRCQPRCFCVSWCPDFEFRGDIGLGAGFMAALPSAPGGGGLFGAREPSGGF